jgi:hypothetical protein
MLTSQKEKETSYRILKNSKSILTILGEKIKAIGKQFPTNKTRLSFLGSVAQKSFS